MKVKIKKLSDKATLPTKANTTDAGFDLYATSIEKKYEGEQNSGWVQYIQYGTDLAIEIPDGYCGLIFPRSSVSKYDLSLCNAVGIVDSGYRGEVCLRFRLTKYIGECKVYSIGEKVGQLVIVPYPEVEFEEAKELSGSDRGKGGFGSSGI